MMIGELVPKSEASWYWRTVCGIKEKLKNFYTNAEIQAMPQYSVKVVYEKMKGEQQKQGRAKCIWNRLNTDLYSGWPYIRSYRLQLGLHK